jgi:RND family efflux transporter MFP subunit
MAKVAHPMNDQLTADLASLSIERPVTPRTRTSHRARFARFVLSCGLLTVVGLVGYRVVIPRASAEIFKTPVSLTEVALVSPAQGAVELTGAGYLVPQVTVEGSSRVSGRVAKVNVREGDEVEAGAVLFELDPIDQRSAITTARARVASSRARSAAAHAQLEETRQQWEREKRLVAVGATATAGADDLGARVRTLTEQAHAADQDTATAEAESSALSIDLAAFTIRAPISGRAINKPVHVGSVVSPGQSMVKLADFASLLVETDVPEGRLQMVHRGAPCEIVFDAYPSRRFRGDVADVAPVLNRAKAAATVKVRVIDRDDTVLPEMAARVSFLAKALDPSQLKEPPKRVVPKNAVALRGSEKVVFTIVDGRARAVPVMTRESEVGLELSEGPPAGTKIIDAPPEALSNGQPIKIKEKTQ